MEDFIKRLEKLMEYYGLSASLFADKIGVQRSGISHLLSGRNKPSLDFVLKISEGFPDVDLYWLLNGKGPFLKKDFAPAPIAEPEKRIASGNGTAVQKAVRESKAIPDKDTAIYKIVIFYDDGSFRDYFPAL